QIGRIYWQQSNLKILRQNLLLTYSLFQVFRNLSQFICVNLVDVKSIDIFDRPSKNLSQKFGLWSIATI
ncbi:MAG: hypothetical protein ACRC62_21260, partial [Microcoleus sp.]